MRRIIIRSHGGPEVLHYEEGPDLVPGPGQALIKVAAAGVNYMDTGTREGYAAGYTDLPMTPGVEGAGTIVALGAGLTELSVGDRVAWFFVWGSYADQLIAPVEALVPLPDDVSFEDAAGVMMQGLTASNLVYESHPIRKGDVALVHAAAGGVGQLVSQMIKELGGTVIGRVSREEKVPVAKAAGADHVIVAPGDGFVQRVLSLTDGRGVDVVYDGTGAESFRGSLESVAIHGTLALLSPSMGPIEPFPLFQLPNSIKITYPIVLHHVRSRQALLQRSHNLFSLLRSNKLKINVTAHYDLSQAAQAHVDLESRRTTGKLLLIP